MKDSEIHSLQSLLKIAEKNLRASDKHLDEVAWPPDMDGVARSISKANLALQQTINTVNAILEDLK